MKVLIVVNLAGFLTFLWNDIKILQTMGYEVEIAMNGIMSDGSKAVEISELNAKKIRYYQVDFDTKHPVSKMNFIAYKQMKAILKNKYAAIHCHTPIAGLITRVVANSYRKKGTKVLYTTHGFAFNDQSAKKLWIIFFTMEKFVSRFCDAIITINHEDFFNAQKMHCDKVYMIPGIGLDYSRFKNITIDRDKYRNSLGVKKNDIMILGVGELSARKNHQIIIKALNKLGDKQKYIFVLCGRAVVNSNIEILLKELADKNGVRLVLMGHRLDIPEINKCADIAVIPSLREGLGMAGLEALASGIPVIGSDVQGIREYVVDGETGYLCSPFDENQFAAAIEKIGRMNENELYLMRKRCKDKAKQFDCSISQKRMKEIYCEILK